MRRSRSEWATIVAEFERSGDAHADFCARRGLELATFRAWLYRLRRARRGSTVARSATKAVKLLPVRVRERPAGPDGGEAIELMVRGVALRVQVGTEVAYVADLVAALAARC